jgi:gamma-glutamyltranspeptidase/glutathione hydrolase
MKGTVAAGQELTARAGVEMLKSGGNAFDAAVAAVFASFVCESAITGAGGGGFFMAHTKDGPTVLFDFFSKVPGKGSPLKTRDIDFFPVYINFADATQELHIGRGSVAVPGCIAGLKTVHERLCTMPLDVLVSPAIKYAREGIRLTAYQANFISILSPVLTVSEEGRKVFAPGGELLGEGDILTNKGMADTFEHLSKEGLQAFYEGDIAGRILEGFGEKGLITGKDLKDYDVSVRQPLTVTYRERIIYTNPPPSSGGCLVAFALKLLEPRDLSGLGHNTAAYVRLLLELMGVTDEARREDFDHRVYEEGMAEEFLSEENVALYRKRLAEGFQSSGLSGEPGLGSTTQISVVDGEGNAAGVTTSTGIGSGFMIPGTGIIMNNFLGEEDLNPHGFHTQSPGTRISSMMAPTMVMRAGRPEIVLGSGGSKRIRSAILQVILNIIDHSMPVARAVDAPRVHWDGKIFQAEPGVDESALEALRKEGFIVNVWGDKDVYFGGVNAVCMDTGGRVSGGGDPRRGCAALLAE